MTPTTTLKPPPNDDERRTDRSREAITAPTLTENARIVVRAIERQDALEVVGRHAFSAHTRRTTNSSSTIMKVVDHATAAPADRATTALRPVSTHPSIDEDDDNYCDDEDKELDLDRASPTSVAATAAALGNLTGIGVPTKAPVVAGVDELEAELRAVQAQRAKMAANLKSKKVQLEEAHAAKVALEEQTADLQATVAELRHDNDNLRAGLQKVVANRDDARSKLRFKNELLRELRHDKDEAERRLRKVQAQRALEQELLGQYRKLAQHTGYCKWGKPIRTLEAQLDQQNLAESQQQDLHSSPRATSPHNSNHHHHK